MTKMPRGDRLAPYVLVAPFAIFLLAFGIGPVAYAVLTSFTKDVGGQSVWVGLTNWTRAYSDRRLPEAVANVATYLGLWLPTMLVLVAGLALLAHARPGRLSAAARLAWYLPGAIAGSAVAMVALYMLTPGVSPFSPVLSAFDVGSGGDLLRGSGTAIVLTVMATAVTAGGWIVVLHAALDGVPEEVLEAARVDGASALQTAFRIKLPLVRGQLALMLIASFAYGTQVFVEPQVLRAGFQAQVSSTWSINQLSYSFASAQGNFGAAAALSLGLLAVGLTVAIAVIRTTDLYAVESGR